MRRPVDTEKVKKVIETLKELPKDRLVITGTGKRVTVSRHSFENFYYENHLYRGSDVDRGEEYLMECPFHEDLSPSFSTNSSRNVCNCLSCQRGGNYISFILAYDREVVGRNISYFEKVEELLVIDRDLAARVGFKSIYLDDEGIDINNIKFFKPKLNKSIKPTTYLELQSYLVKHGKVQDQDILQFITLMTEGTSPQDIYRIMFRDNGYEFNSVAEEMQSVFQLDYEVGGFYG